MFYLPNWIVFFKAISTFLLYIGYAKLSDLRVVYQVDNQILANVLEGVSNIIDGDLESNSTEKSDIFNR